MKKSSKKTEAKAIDIINDLVDEIDFAYSNLNKDDKHISWDGTIDFYSDNVDKKENYEFSIDTQVKGRTITSKKFAETKCFDVEVSDLKNFLKKDGTLFLIVVFKGNEHKIYYKSLLPYDIRLALNNIQNKTKVNIKFKELKNSIELESICRNFHLDRQKQKLMDKNAFNENNLQLDSQKIAKFQIWQKDLNNFKPESLIGTYHYEYIYDINNTNIPIGISYGVISDINKNIDLKVSDINRNIVFNNVIFHTSQDKFEIIFGKAFSLNLINNKIYINIKGSLEERLAQYKFLEYINKDKKFLINNMEFILNDDVDKKFHENMSKLIEFKNILEKHNIYKDINLDLWEDSDYADFNIWMNAIEDGLLLKINSDISLIGCIKIKDLKLAIIAMRNLDGTFKIESIWNNTHNINYGFKYKFGDLEICTSNIFLVLNKDTYLADDFNFDELKELFDNYTFGDGEYELLNLQILELIDVYDETQKEYLLDYALYLMEILIKNDPSENIHYINYCQILKRRNKLTNENYEKLVQIRDNTNDNIIKLCCTALLDNKVEMKMIMNKINNKDLEVLKTYPINKYFI